MKYKEILLLSFCLFGCIFANGMPEQKVEFRIKHFATIRLDSVETDASLKIDWALYMGPASMDIDSSGSLYLLNGDNNQIEKFSKNGKRIWKIPYREQILDIKLYGDDLFTFDGVNILTYGTQNGQKKDSLNLGLKPEDITAVGNVSKFYGQYLLVNKWPVKTKEQLHVFDLKSKKISPRIPKGIDIYPIFECSACSLSFVRNIFENKGYNYVDQSSKYILFVRNNKKQELLNRFYLFNKTTGEISIQNNIPFFKEIAFTTIRFCRFIATNKFIVSTIKSVDYVPVSLEFYEVSILALSDSIREM
jgi:hypothetical protein